ncbi:MAG: cupredoxin domain-containing protein [Nitrososphaeraceae archaeon]
MKHQVIIPQFLSNESIRNYIPPTVKIQKGDTITWINTNNESHHLYFIKIDPDPTNIEVLDEKLCLNSGEVGEIMFNYNYERIDYVCKIHRREINSITIFTEYYENMSNIQRLRYLHKRYNIKIPNLSNYLDGNI